MSAKLNRVPMSISVGEAGTLEETMRAGDAYCRSHLPQVPRLTREQIAAIPGVKFPAPEPTFKRPHIRKDFSRRVTSDQEREQIVAMYRAKHSLSDIAGAVHRERCTVRDVLIRAGVYVAPVRPWSRGIQFSNTQHKASK